MKLANMLHASVVLSLCLGGCSFYARGPEDYRKAVRNVLDQHQDQVTSCYDQSLQGDQALAGKVVVHFEVEPKTGNIVKPEIVPGETTANETLQGCVLKTLDGLKVDPPDQRKGDATFAWEFSR